MTSYINPDQYGGLRHERTCMVPIAEGWFETDSRSDGMCGAIVIEHPETTSVVSFHWCVDDDDPRYGSQSEAREAARCWIEAGCPEEG